VAASLLSSVSPLIRAGRVIESQGRMLRSSLPSATLGELVTVETSNGESLFRVTGFRNELAFLTPLEESVGIRAGARVEALNCDAFCCWSSDYIGQPLDSLGNPLEELSVNKLERLPLQVTRRKILEREPLSVRFMTGVKALDTFVPMLKGQRLLIAAEAGVGKTSLIKEIAIKTNADVTVITLVGERGREAREFISSLDLNRSVIIISTSDEPATRRIASAETAVAISRKLAAEGKDVLLLMDSLTRYGRALRDDALSVGEPAVRRGYPASVFSALPLLLEQAGNFSSGSITGIFTMLLNGELDEDPLIEEVKGVVDGHAILRQEIAERGIFPALSVHESLSRVERDAVSEEHHRAIMVARRVFSKLAKEKKLAYFSSQLEPELKAAMELESNFWELVDSAKESPQSDLETLTQTFLLAICESREFRKSQ